MKWYAAGALLAFAANSVLCRLALQPGAIDPRSYTAVRLVSGALVLALLCRLRGGEVTGSWRSALALFGYALPFSLAYLDLGAGTGALVLFAAVQLTMFAAGLTHGERPGWRTWSGVSIALGGLVVLVSPGLSMPTPAGLLAMTVAGVAWGLYSLAGRGNAQPIAATAGNFALASPIALIALLPAPELLHVSKLGLVLALVSGTVASGLGYVAWYTALPQLSASRAAVVQLLVPPLAAVGGVVVLAEPATVRLGVATLLIVGGISWSLSWADGRPRPIPTTGNNDRANEPATTPTRR